MSFPLLWLYDGTAPTGADRLDVVAPPPSERWWSLDSEPELLALADPDRRVAAGAVAVPGLAFATADGFAPRLALSGSVASRVLVLEVAPVPPVRRYGPPAAGEPCAVHGSGTGFTSVQGQG